MKHFYLCFWLFLPLFSVVGQTSAKIEPIYPAEQKGLVYWEAEEALATNFNKEATLDYNSSGQRMLQLNSATGLYQGAAFFAEYMISLPEDGTYEFWFAGLPVGPKDELKASYASPFSLVIDGAAPVDIYRENTNVVERYSVINHWSRFTTPLKLTKGPHKIRIEVKEKRRFDSRYYLFLDAFFFLKTPQADWGKAPLPAQFPKNLASRAIDNPYLSTAQYEIKIQADPKSVGNYVDIAQVYTLLGDYTSALKYLNQAKILAPDDPDLLLLVAKNKIWSRELEDGFQVFKNYLNRKPKDLAVWSEVGKLMAWTGKYNDAIDNYKRALTVFPDELSLTVNLGLTYLWANRIAEGESQLNQAWKIVGKKESLWKTLGQVYETNGYPDRAEDVYGKATQQFPANLEFYLLWQASLARNGQTEAAGKVRQKIQEVFTSSEQLTNVLALFEEREGLREKALEDYRKQLLANPDDLNLRKLYLDGLFWNGKKQKAIEEFGNLLVNHLFRVFTPLENDSLALYQSLDGLTLARAAYQNLKTALQKKKDLLASLVNQYQTAFQNEQQWAQTEKNKKLSEDETKQRAKASDDLAAVKASLGAEIGAVKVYADAVDSFEKTAAALDTEVDALVKQGKSDEERLSKVSEPQKWSWDRTGTFLELQRASQSGVTLADYLLTRINTNEGNYEEAKSHLGGFTATKDLPWADSLRFQTQLWGTPTTDTSLLPAPYYNYRDKIQSLAGQYALPVVPITPWNDAIPGQVLGLVDEIPKLLSRVDQNLWAVTQKDQLLHQALMAKMKIAFFQYDQDMVLLRYQLGDYNIGAEQYDEARRQLRKVTQMDPWNTSAKFRLGNVSQLMGDWNSALTLYKEVYQTDPKFESVASIHNQVAKQHADTLGSEVKAFNDNQRSTTTASLMYTTSLNTEWSLGATVSKQQLTLYNQQKADDWITEIKTPWLFAPWKLTVTPIVGAQVDNKGIRTNTTGTLDQTNWWTAQQFLPQAGLEALWLFSNPLQLWGAYNYGVMADTLTDGESPIGFHKGELALSSYFSFQPPSWVTVLSTRTYLKAQLVADNLLSSVVQEGVFVFHAADNPWTNFTLIGTGSFESRTQASPTNSMGNARYYSPPEVLIFKVSGQVNTWLGLNGSVLGLSARLGGGPDMEHVINGPLTTYTLVEGELRAELTKDDWTAYLAFYTGTSSGTSTYWSNQGTVGLRLAIPSYIVP